MAIAISKAENGTRQCDRVNVNKNNSLDIGLFQINTVHLKKGYSLKELMDCKRNIEIAYSIFKQQSWTPWVTYKNKSFQKFYGH